MCCSGVNVPPNQPGDIAFIYGENKDLSENQSGSAVKLDRLVLRLVGI